MGGASACGGRDEMQSKRGLRLEGAWLVWAGRASKSGGGAKTESRRGLILEGAWLVRVLYKSNK